MKLTLVRDQLSAQRTLGVLYDDVGKFCYSLEDTVRDVKIKGQTCIPYGTYAVKLTLSNRFQVVLPLLLDVPGFEGIRIHAGNTEADTEGCILVGEGRSKEVLFHSRKALDRLMARLASEDDITIEIKRPDEVAQ